MIAAALSLLAAQNYGEDAANALFRWIHIVAGVIWIGHLYFFNFVNAEVAKTYDADSKRKVVPELMPRALFWFRWGAAWTWITGVLLLAILYWHQQNFGAGGQKAALVAFVIIAVLFPVYDAIAKALAKQGDKALLVWYLFVWGYACLVLFVDFFGASPRGAYIHVGGLLGTTMAANVWMRIWPCQKRIISAIKAGTPPDPADAALAGLRSRHNTYMSVPLLFLMLNVHTPFTGTTFGEPGIWILGVLLVGYPLTALLYKKAAKVKGF